MGCDVVESPDAETAIGALVELDGRVDVLVTDNDMPGMSGRELITWVRARWPALPIIMISGGSAIDHDANVLLTKPFSPRDLQATLERLAPSAGDDPT
jgi:CheY-like chemotaxis protein